MKTSLAIVIPTRDRPDKLRDTLRYYRDKRVEVPLVLLDSSGPEQYDAVQEVCRSSGLDTRVHHFDPQISILSKLRDGMPLIDERYIAVATDDDLLCVPGFLDIAAELADRPHLASLGGWEAKTSVPPRWISALRLRLRIRRFGWIEGQTARERLFSYLREKWHHSVHLFYRVHRRDAFHSALEDAASLEHGLSDLFSVEMLYCFNAIHGEHQVYDHPYMARFSHPGNSSKNWPRMEELDGADDFSTRLGEAVALVIERIAPEIAEGDREPLVTWVADLLGPLFGQNSMPADLRLGVPYSFAPHANLVKRWIDRLDFRTQILPKAIAADLPAAVTEQIIDAVRYRRRVELRG